MYGQPEPDYSSITGLLYHMNNEELKKLLNDEVSLERLIKDLPQVKKFSTEKEMCMTTNKSLAEFNLSKEPQLRQTKQRLVETYERAVEVFKNADMNKQKLEDLSRQSSADTTLAILQTAAAQSEEDSEKIAEKFLEGGAEIEAFLDEFQNKRKLAHLRRVKAEKMNELLNPSPSTVNWHPHQSAYNVQGRTSAMYGQRI
ncbi:hypothetical protein CHUAL_013725 [Chamberlinius hualienensis]